MKRMVIALVLSGCANDLRVDHPFDGETTTGPLVVASVLDTGGTQLLIDATNKMSQVYVDLDEGREMKPSEAFETNGWDLSLRRFDIFVNSGASGPTGTVEIAVLKDVDYASLTQAPAAGFTADTGARVFNTSEGGWYFYDLGVHRLITRTELVYVIHTSAGAYVKLRMLSYYDQNGTPASISLEYAPIAAP
ncbi:MAG: HmuY family protein [Archangium sp.]|nr:HmuY family protein [Archangium sp.]MDP3573338.1 HmuY family protein [Archangium sp.]